jgi:hypothetical protein
VRALRPAPIQVRDVVFDDVVERVAGRDAETGASGTGAIASRRGKCRSPTWRGRHSVAAAAGSIAGICRPEVVRILHRLLRCGKEVSQARVPADSHCLTAKICVDVVRSSFSRGGGARPESALWSCPGNHGNPDIVRPGCRRYGSVPDPGAHPLQQGRDLGRFRP